MSPALAAKLQELRAFAADPEAVVYVFQTKTTRFLILPEEIDAHATDDSLLAYLAERIKEAGSTA